MASFTTLCSAVTLAVFAKQAVAWGNLGHETVGYVAQNVSSYSKI